MKIHSVAWGWTPTPEDAPHGDSLHRIANSVKELGFDGIDFLSTFESLDEYYTQENVAGLRAHCVDLGLDIGGLVFQSDPWNHPDSAVKARQLFYFDKCVRAAEALGAGIISCILPRPYGAKPTRAHASPSEKQAYRLPFDFSWQEDWARFVDLLGEACDRAAKAGIDVALECFPGSICSTPHAMLKILDDVGRTNLYIQLDTAHLVNQRIDVETAIFMLGGNRIRHVHLKDSDGLTRGNLPAGSGIVDYTQVFRALEAVGYRGRASVEVEFTDNPARYMRQALNHVRECMNGQY